MSSYEDNQDQTYATRVSYISNAKPTFRLLEEMWVERGTREDWLLLRDLHYKLHSEPVGAKYWRLRFRGETIGVCVFGMSRPLLKERHALMPLIKPGQDSQISNIARYAKVNDSFRVVGRFVVDTMYRSSGVAYRFLNLAARQFGFRYIEIQSSMSKYNMFAQRAGFMMTKPIRSPNYEKGLKFMRRWFESHVSDTEALMHEFNTMPKALRERVERELKTFYYDTSPLEKTGSRRFYALGVVDNWDVRRTISKIQGLCFASPLYGVYKNPDAQNWAIGDKEAPENLTNLPDMLPLLSFDLQLPTEAMRVGEIDNLGGWNALKEKIIACNWREVTDLTGHKQTAEKEHEDEA